MLKNQSDVYNQNIIGIKPIYSRYIQYIYIYRYII